MKAEDLAPARRGTATSRSRGSVDIRGDVRDQRPSGDATFDPARDPSENPFVRDDDVRSACFAALDVLQAKWGVDIPYAVLADGFNFRGRRVPFLNRAYGIYRSAGAQNGPAALSVNSSPRQIRYQDEQTADGVLYRYQGDDRENHFNRWLRSAHLLDVPIVYFVGTRRGWYRAIYPTYVERDEPEELRVLLTFGKMRGPYDEREPVHIPDEIERRYVVREVKQRIHQAQFRGAVLPAYSDRCAICRLREVRLLDAAHIVADAEEHGEPVVANGLSLCSIHHRAFDEDLVGVAPDHRVHVSARLLDDDDGPMLEVLKGFHGRAIETPVRRVWRPDPDRLAARFERFLAAG
jgi:putative restriction endonuclease